MIPIIQVSSNSTKPTAAVKATAVPVAHGGGGQMVRRTPLQAVGHQCLECYDPFTCFRHISCLGTHDVLQHILEYVPTYSHTLLRMIHKTLFLQVQCGGTSVKATPKTNANANVQKPKTFTLPSIHPGMNQKPKTFTLPSIYPGMNTGGSRYSDCDSDSDDSSDSNDDSESDVFSDFEDDNGVNFDSHEQLNHDARFAGSMVQEEILSLSNNSVSPPTPVASNSEASPTTPRTELSSYELGREREIEKNERRLKELGLLSPMKKTSPKKPPPFSPPTHDPEGHPYSEYEQYRSRKIHLNEWVLNSKGLGDGISALRPSAPQDSEPKKKTVKKKAVQVRKYDTRNAVSRTHQYRISLINILLSICILYDNLQTKETSSTTSDQPSSSRKQVEVNVQVEVKRIVELHCITKSSITSHIQILLHQHHSRHRQIKTLRRIILPLHLLVTTRGAPTRIQHLRLVVTARRAMPPRHLMIQRSLARTIVRKVPRGNPLRVIVTTRGVPTSLLVTATTRGAPTRIQHLHLLVTATRAMPARFLLVQNRLSLAISQHSLQKVESSFTVQMTLTHHIMYVS